MRAVALDVAAPARAFAAAGLAADSVMRVLMNPPFNDPARQRTSPDAARALAHAAPRAVLAPWIKTAARLLRARGTLTLIWRADGLADVLSALAPAFGAVAVTPVHPAPDKPAIRILATAVKASRAPLALLPPLVLADASGRPTAAAEAVLRDGAALPDHALRCSRDCVRIVPAGYATANGGGSKTSVRAFLRLAASADMRGGRDRGNQGQQHHDLHFHLSEVLPTRACRQRDVARSVPMVENW